MLTTGIGADHASLIKSEELYSDSLERAPKCPLAAAERPSRCRNALTAVATLEKRDQKKSQLTFKGSVNACERESSITQFKHHVGLLQQHGQLSFELVHMTGEP